MAIPGIAYFLLFRYGPMYGLIIAFKDFQVLSGILGSPWAGFQHFHKLFSTPVFGRVLRNTIVISVLKVVVSFPPPIILALLLNELRVLRLKKVVQTVSYLPHFLSWIIISGILIAFLSPGSGLVNNWIKAAGGKPVAFLTDNGWFIVILVLSQLWKEAGWSAIVYLAALSGIDPELYEAATLDGANRFQQIIRISLPSIVPVITLMFILRLGYIMDAGFEQIYILYSPQVYGVADIIDTWVFRNGIEQMQFSLAAAASFFKSIIGLLLILVSNKALKQWTGSGMW